MRRLALALLIALAACDGATPPPPIVGPQPACTANAAPPGYSGPVSPFAGPCPVVPMAAPKPSGVWDYSQGAPPRAVRGR